MQAKGWALADSRFSVFSGKEEVSILMKKPAGVLSEAAHRSAIGAHRLQ
jgi:hypothetical protein